MSNVLKIVGFIALVLLAAVAINYNIETNKQKAIDWATSHGYTVQSCKEPFFDYGPFYVKDDNQHIFRLEVKDRYEKPHVFYWRNGIFHDDVEEWR